MFAEASFRLKFYWDVMAFQDKLYVQEVDNVYIETSGYIAEIKAIRKCECTEWLHAATKHVAAKHIAANHVAAKHVATKHVATKHIAAKHVATKHLATKQVAAKHVVTKHVATKHVATIWSE